jgi:ankyrin repeat protein
MADAQSPFNGYIALHEAVWRGHIEAARVLLAAGARTDLAGDDCTGIAPLLTTG